MKSRFEAGFFKSNNFLRMHGYAMVRRGGKRKNLTLRDMLCVPFPEGYLLRRGRRVKKVSK